MLSKQDVAKLYETVLSIPGMNEAVRLDLKIPRKNVLLLSKIIQRGLAVENEDAKGLSILDVMPKEAVEELAKLSKDILEKSGLQEMDEKLSSFKTT